MELQHQPSNEYSGLIFFRIDVGSPCSPRHSQESSPTPQFKSINFSALSFLYGPNMLYRLIITFLPRKERLLISWLQSPSAVILEPPKIKSEVSTVSPSISHEVMKL